MKKTEALPFLPPPGDDPAGGDAADCVLARELRHIGERRRGVFPQSEYTDEATFASGKGAMRDAHAARPFGVSFSGGGIRSATFNLGILQGLAERGLLKHVDYLSTVSGGGYIGSWLHAVIRRRSPDAAAALLSPAEHRVPGAPQDDPISFLRKFSNYLAPRPGAFSVDTWVMGTIWLRNVLLNQLVLLPIFAALAAGAVAVGWMEYFFLNIAPALPDSDSRFWNFIVESATEEIVIFAVVLFAGGVYCGFTVLRGIVQQTFPGSGITGVTETRATLARSSAAIWLLLAGGMCLGFAVPDTPPFDHHEVAVLAIGVSLSALFLVFQYFGGFPQCYRAAHGPGALDPLMHAVWMSALSAAVASGLIWIVWYRAPWADWPAAPWLRVTLGPPLVCASLVAGGTLQTGLMGADYPDAAREWMARVAAAVWLRCFYWIAVFGIVVFGPWMFARLLGSYGATAVSAIVAWAGTVAAGVLAGNSAKTGGDRDANRSPLRWLVAIAPPLFVGGYLVLVAAGVHVALRQTAPWPAFTDTHVNADGSYRGGALDKRLAPARQFSAQYWTVLKGDVTGRENFTPVAPSERAGWLALIIGICGAVGLVANWRININEFSMHHFYKNRLVRCYLGASNGKRKPNAYTGFDSSDDVCLKDLLPALGYHGPYAIVNATLNLNAGSELATQERKSDSFVFTPAFCGFSPSKANEVDEDEKWRRKNGLDRFGYRETAHYSHPTGPHIGTAMAISGAAANPNSGYHTSGPMAFLLTVFNARLGWWLGNPRHPKASKAAGPLLSSKYLLDELAGQTTATTKFVNLSDGGHFENLGLYELIRRRCRYIVIGDGEQDENMTFEGLGGAIRKCRADFGVEIDLRPEPIRLDDKRFSGAHCVVGLITYPEDETGCADTFTGATMDVCEGGRARGWILYLKASVTGDEPADVLQYRSQNTAFPQETTGDQFFSESQFESYRRLGLHIARTAFEGVPAAAPGSGDAVKDPGGHLLRTFQALARNWYPPPAVDGDPDRLTTTYTELMRRLGEDNALEDLAAELLPGGMQHKHRAMTRVERLYLVEIVQLMEDVFSAYALESAANRANPRVAGWMRVFERWSNSPSFRVVWGQVRLDYNPLFRQFVGDTVASSLAKPTDLPPRA